MAYLVTSSQTLPLLPRTVRGQKSRHRGGANPSPHWGSSLHFRKLHGSFRDQAFGDRRCMLFMAAAGVVPLVLLFLVLANQWMTTMEFLKLHALHRTKVHSFDVNDNLAKPPQRHAPGFISRLLGFQPFVLAAIKARHESGSKLVVEVKGGPALNGQGQASIAGPVAPAILENPSPTENGPGNAAVEVQTADAKTGGAVTVALEGELVNVQREAVPQANVGGIQLGAMKAEANDSPGGVSGTGDSGQKGAEPGAANLDSVAAGGAVGESVSKQTEGTVAMDGSASAVPKSESSSGSQTDSAKGPQQALSSNDHLLMENLMRKFERYEGFEAHKEDYGEVVRLHRLMAPLAAAANNTVVVIPTNDGFMDFAMNTWCRLQELGAPNVLIWAFDSPSAKKLEAKGIPYYYDPTLYSISERRAFEDEEYIRLMSNKPKVWWKMIATGFDLLFLDADSAIFDRPEKAFNMTLDIEGQYDAWHYMEEAPLVRDTIMCAGAVWFRSNTATLKTMDYVISTFDRNHTKRWDDQMALNDAIRNPNMTVLKDNWLPDPAGSELVLDRARVGYVQLTRILSGHTFWFIKHFPEKGFDDSEKMTICLARDKNICMDYWPVVIHFNGCCQQEERRTIMQKNGWWRVSPNGECEARTN